MPDLEYQVKLSNDAGCNSENHDMFAVMEEMKLVNARISEIDKALTASNTAKAGPGVQAPSVVDLEFAPGDSERFVFGSVEEAVHGYEVLSPESPLGEALVGKDPGDTCEARVAGNRVTFLLVSAEDIS